MGAIEIVPARADLFARWVTKKENMLFLLEDRCFADLAAQEFDLADVELEPPRPGTIDKQAAATVQVPSADACSASAGTAPSSAARERPLSRFQALLGHVSRVVAASYFGSGPVMTPIS